MFVTIFADAFASSQLPVQLRTTFSAAVRARTAGTPISATGAFAGRGGVVARMAGTKIGD